MHGVAIARGLRRVNAFLYKLNFCTQTRLVANSSCGYANITVEELVSKWQDRFQKCSIPEPSCSVELLTAHVLGMKTVSNYGSVSYIATISKTSYRVDVGYECSE